MTQQRVAVPTSTVPLMTVTGLIVVGQLYAVLPLLPEMAGDWGSTPAATTWTVTSFGLAYAFGFLLAGPLSDRYGRRTVISFGLAVLAVATLLVATAGSLPMACFFRVLQGLGAAGFSPAALAYLGERVSPSRRAVALTWLVTSYFAAAAVGQLYAQMLVVVVGWRGVFVVSAVLVALVAVLLRLVLLPSVSGSGSVADSFRAMGRLVSRPGPALLCVAAVSVLGGFAGLYTALQMGGPAERGTMVLLRAAVLPSMVAVTLVAAWFERFRATVRAAGGLVVGAVSTLALTSADSVLSAVAVLVVFGAAITVVSPGLTQLMGDLAAPARGAGVAVYTFALLVGASVGPPLVASLRSHGFGTMLLAIAATQLAGAALLLAVNRLLPRH